MIKKDRHDATKLLKAARRKYQPIKEKHSEQEKAVGQLKAAEMVGHVAQYTAALLLYATLLLCCCCHWCCCLCCCR